MNRLSECRELQTQLVPSIGTIFLSHQFMQVAIDFTAFPTEDKLSSATCRVLVPKTTHLTANQSAAYEESGAIPLPRSSASLLSC